jgi:hypothetical protein
MLRHKSANYVPTAALGAAKGWSDWPARLQQLHTSPLY